jgi:peptide/nickel transport system permease protein
VRGRSPRRGALRKLWLDRGAVVGVAIFAAVVAFVLAAPLWADHVAGTGPNDTHTVERVEVDGERRDVVSVDGTPLGPIWLGDGGRFFLGADGRLGRDEMVRLMYGGRASLLIALSGALIATVSALVLALLAGYFRGPVDAVVSFFLDLIWAFPALLLGIALGAALAVGGLQLGPLSISAGSLWIPTLIGGLVFTPYIARPLRGEVLALREQEFVKAAVASGAGPWRVMLGELLPNLWSTAIVLFTVNVANLMLLEAGLSFFGTGVQAPDASWGTMIADGFELIYSTPLLMILPSALIFLTVLSLNLIGDGLSAALNPRSRASTEAHTGRFEAKRGAA